LAHPYIPLTDDDRAAMLKTVGVATTDELFTEIPAGHRDPAFDLPPALSELELLREMASLAGRSQSELPSFLGAGAYRHFIPSTVNHIISRGEYLTAYTPYQPEISQGTLQTVFEFQSLVCELTGMEIANAGMYDGASALAEACLMACSVTGRDRILLADTIHSHIAQTVETYAAGRGLTVETVSLDAAASAEGDTFGNVFANGDDAACLAVQQPDFFGGVRDLTSLADAAHAAGALFAVSADPVSLGMYRTPGDYGADIVVGDGQPLASPPNFGGPYVGLFACRAEYQRHMPGRICGRTTDLDGRTGYVLTLQTR